MTIFTVFWLICIFLKQANSSKQIPPLQAIIHQYTKYQHDTHSGCQVFWVDGHIYIHTYIHTYKLTYIQTDRQTDTSLADGETEDIFWNCLISHKTMNHGMPLFQLLQPPQHYWYLWLYNLCELQLGKGHFHFFIKCHLGNTVKKAIAYNNAIYGQPLT